MLAILKLHRRERVKMGHIIRRSLGSQRIIVIVHVCSAEVKE